VAGYSRPDDLSEHHSLTDFTCGEESIDSWVQGRVRANQALGFSRTFVTTEPDSDLVVGLYCLSSVSVPRQSVGKPERGSDPPRDLPAVLLGKLAVVSHLQDSGIGLGTDLMRDAIVRTLTVSLSVVVRLMVVDALNERLTGWYERFGFTSLKQTDWSPTTNGPGPVRRATNISTLLPRWSGWTAGR